MNALTRSLLIVTAVIIAVGLCSLAPVTASAGPTAKATSSSVANTVSKDQQDFDPYALRSPYTFVTHNCPQEDCGTVDQCGNLPPGTTCGREAGCTCKKCHNWGVCTHGTK